MENGLALPSVSVVSGATSTADLGFLKLAFSDDFERLNGFPLALIRSGLPTGRSGRGSHH
jgi:hypothetical protein